jgi:hypothetical protein
MLQRILIVCILFFLQSCKENEIKKINNEPINKKFTERDTINIVKIDSSLLTKAFEDIYFGSKTSLNYTKDYTIANLEFNISSDNSDKEFGLYGFNLESKPLCDYTSCKDIIEDIKSVISVKYPNVKKFKLKSEPTEYTEFQNKYSNNHHIVPPGDNFKNKFYEWKNNGITIDVSTTTFYRPNDGNPKFIVYCPTSDKFQKYFTITLKFSKDKVYEIHNERYKNRIKQEEEGYKSILKKDETKF